MFHQLLTPVGDNLLLSFLVAAVPIAVVLVMLGILRRPAWQASATGLLVALIGAVDVSSDQRKPSEKVAQAEVQQRVAQRMPLNAGVIDASRRSD